ncbi:MAG TPA: tetratricopeptide repeat protein [Blastocatellia bacterium]|nr:tetratricopeptide repeat protein [Blastocatellia bacterium]
MKSKPALHQPAQLPKPSLPGRNELCSCGSGKKYKKCCAALQAPAAIAPDRRDPLAIWRSARESFEVGELGQALEKCDLLLKINPTDPESLHLRGLVAHRQGNHAAGLKDVQRAIKQAPRTALFHNTLGVISGALDRLEAAEAAYRAALRLDPGCASAYLNLGDLFETRGQLAEAESCYRLAVEHEPQTPEMHNNLGKLLARVGRFEEAAFHLARAIEIRPDFDAAHYNLARALAAMGRSDEALAALTLVLKRSPGMAIAWHDLGLHFKGRSALAEARAAFERTLQLAPEMITGYFNLGSVYYELGLGDHARDCVERAHALKPSDALKIRGALLLPGVYQSMDEIRERRDRLTAEIDQLMAEDLRVDDPNYEISLIPFFLAYQGLNDVALLSRIADLLLKACPSLGFVAPHCAEPRPAPQSSSERIKIGFLSAYLGRRNHIVDRVMAGFISRWPRERFQVVILYADQPGAVFEYVLGTDDKLVGLPSNLAAARERVAAERLDILFYTDLGLDPWTYFLSFARLAHLQCTSGGHPVTSGVPAVDYFISSTVDEGPRAREHYREEVVLLSERPVCYFPAAASTPVLNLGRADFGLSDDRRIYLCPMTPFKLHPEMDRLFAEILRSDTGGEVVFVLNRQTDLWQLLQERFARTIPDVLPRLRYLSYQPLPEFLTLLRLTDVVLDTLHFGGGTTSLESLAVGTPVITLPGELLRQRATAGLYRRMGLADCIAGDEAEYVRLAVEIATQPDRRAAIKREILARNQVLFGQEAGVREAAEFLLSRSLEKSGEVKTDPDSDFSKLLPTSLDFFE